MSRGRPEVLTIDVTAINGAPPPVPMSARFDQTGGAIGRDAGCTLVLPDPEKRISRRHAMVEFKGGGYRLRNQGSAIAVLVNGAPVDYGADTALANGDRIDIGDFSLRVHADAAVTAPTPAPAMARPAARADDILAGFGPPAGASDPFADLIPPAAPVMTAVPAAPAAMPPPRAPAPAPRASAPAPVRGAIPDDFDPFRDVPAPPPPASATPDVVGRGNFDDLVPRQHNRVDELFGLRSGDPFPPGHPLAAQSAAATPGPSGIDDLLNPGVTPGGPSVPFAPVQRDDAPELGSSMRLPDAQPAPAASSPPRVDAVQETAPAARLSMDAPGSEPSEDGPGTVGGMRLSWDLRTEDGVFDATKTAVIGSATPDRRHGERRRSAPSEAAAQKVSPPPGEEAARAEQALLHALLEGLGLERWPEERKIDAETMRRLGALMRVAVQGTIDLLRARALIKSEVQAQMTMIVSRDNNPLKFSPNAEAALAHLLGPAQRGFMSANAAMEDAYRDLVAHQFGFTAGTRAALADVLGRFDPAKLETRLATKSVFDALLPAHRKARLWDLFTERFAQISAEAEDDFQRLLGKEFLRAYEEQVAKLTAPGHNPER